MISRPNLSNHIASAILVCIFVVIIIGAGLVTSQKAERALSQNLIADDQHQEIELATAIAKSLQGEVISIQEKLTLISELPEVQQAQSKACNQKLEEVFNAMERKVGNLGRVNKSGIFACSLNQALVGTKAEKLGSYITEIFTDPHHQPVMSRAIKPPGANGYVAAVHVPVFTSSGQFDGTIGGAIYFNQLQEKYFKDVRLTKKGYIILLDDDGTVLYHPESNLIGQKITSVAFRNYASPQSFRDMIVSAIQGKTGSKLFAFGGEQQVAAYSAVSIFPNRRWILVVVTPEQDIEAKLTTLHVDRLFKSFVALNSLIILITAALFLYFIIRNIRRLEEFNTRLKQLDKMKDEFVSIASHELRTPLTAIKGLISMMFEGDYGKIPATLKGPLDDVQSSANRLILLVNDMLDMARIEAGRTKFVLGEIDLDTVIINVVDSLQPLAKEKKLKLGTDSLQSTLVQADEGKVQEVLHNIIGNALKFTDAGSITVSIAPSHDMATVFITDTGVGISPEDQKKLFQKFKQISTNKAGRPAGTGLGLYIAREFTRRMGGDLWIEKSVPGTGTTFAFSLPLAKSDKAATIKKEIEQEAITHPDQK